MAKKFVLVKKDSLVEKGSPAWNAGVTAWMRKLNAEKVQRGKATQETPKQGAPKQKTPKQLLNEKARARVKAREKRRPAKKAGRGERLNASAMKALREGNPLDQTVYTDGDQVIHKLLPGSFENGKRKK